MVTWNFRYRTPRGTLETVQIETFTKDEAEANALAQKHLDTLNSPGVRFVYVQIAVAVRSLDYPDLVEQYGGSEMKPDPPRAPKPTTKPDGRIGA